MNEILTVMLFIPLLFILWLANLADRRRPAAGVSHSSEALTGPGLAPAETTTDVTPPGAIRAGDFERGPGAALPYDRPDPGAADELAADLRDREAAVPETGATGALRQADDRGRPLRREAGTDAGAALAAIAYTLLVLAYLGLFGIGLVIELVGAAARGPNSAGMAATFNQAGYDGPALVRALAGIQPGLGLSIWIPALAGIVLLLRPVRRLIARAIPIDPARTVHAVALSFTMIIVINLLTTAVAMPQITAALEQQAAQGETAVSAASLWVQDLLLLLLGIVGVGWLARRSLPAALARLDIRAPSWGQVGLGIGVGIGMVVIAIGLQWFAGLLNFGENADVQKLTEILVGPLTQSLFGVITLGAAAALGEETIFRGALQPRFGLVFTAILFTLTHNQYGFSLSTLVVLILAFVLGIIRNRANTTTAMIVHATFNCVQGLLAYLSLIK